MDKLRHIDASSSFFLSFIFALRRSSMGRRDDRYVQSACGSRRHHFKSRASPRGRTKLREEQWREYPRLVLRLRVLRTSPGNDNDAGHLSTVTYPTSSNCFARKTDRSLRATLSGRARADPSSASLRPRRRTTQSRGGVLSQFFDRHRRPGEITRIITRRSSACLNCLAINNACAHRSHERELRSCAIISSL